MRDQSNAIREQVSFKQREDHIRQTWMFLCKHYKLNKSDLVKFLIKKEGYFLRRPEGVLSGIVHDWMWNGNQSPSGPMSHCISTRATGLSGALPAWDLPVAYEWNGHSATESNGTQDSLLLPAAIQWIVRPEPWFGIFRTRSEIRSPGKESFPLRKRWLIMQ